MREPLLEDLKKLSTYRGIEKGLLEGLIYFTTAKWRRDYEILTPTHKNLELLDMFDRNFPEIKWINEYKSNNSINLLTTIYNGIVIQSQPENILQKIIDSSLIVYKNDENFKKYEDMIDVTKIMAGGRKPPLRRVPLFEKRPKGATDRATLIRRRFVSSLNHFVKGMEINEMWFFEDYLNGWYDLYVDIDLKQLKLDYLDIVTALRNEDEIVFKKMMNQARKELRKRLSNESPFKDHYKWKFSGYSRSATLNMRSFTESELKRIEQNFSVKDREFADKYKFSFTTKPSNNRRSDDISFKVMVGLEYDALMKGIYELIDRQ